MILAVADLPRAVAFWRAAFELRPRVEVPVYVELEFVRLTPVESSRPRRVIGSARGLVTIGDDFDAPIEDFAPYER